MSKNRNKYNDTHDLSLSLSFLHRLMVPRLLRPSFLPSFSCCLDSSFSRFSRSLRSSFSRFAASFNSFFVGVRSRLEDSGGVIAAPDGDIRGELGAGSLSSTVANDGI